MEHHILDDVRVNDDTGSAVQTRPDLIVCPNGTLVAVWEDYRDGSYGDSGDIYAAWSTDRGHTWSTNVRVTDDTPGGARRRTPHAAVSPRGDVYVVWEDWRNDPNPTDPASTPTDFQNPDIYLSKMVRGQLSFSANIRVYAQDDAQFSPDVVVDGQGQVYLCWADRTGDLYYDAAVVAKSTDGGQTFGVPVVIDNHDMWALAPRMAIDRNSGVVYVTFMGHPQYYKPYFTRSVDGGTTWSTDVRLDAGPDIDWYDGMYYPEIAADDNGRVLVLWGDERNDPDNCYSCSTGHDELDVYCAYSTDGGVTWAPENVRINDDSTNDRIEHPKAAYRWDGSISIVFRDSRDGDAVTDIYSARSSDDGATWTPSTRVDQAPTGAQSYPVVAAPGGWDAIAWADPRNGDADIYVKPGPEAYLPQYYLFDFAANWRKPAHATNQHVDRDGNGEIQLFDGVRITDRMGHLAYSTAQNNIDMATLPDIYNLVVTADTILFDYSSEPDIQPGDLVYDDDVDGYLRRVVQVDHTTPGEMQLHTVPASLAELFADGPFGFRQNLGPASSAKDRGTLDLVDLSGVVLYEDNFSGTTNGVDYQANVYAAIDSGTLSFSPNFHLDASYGWGLETVDIGVSGPVDIDFQATVQANASGEYTGFEGYLLGPFVTPVVTPSGIPVSLECHILGGVDVVASVTGSITAGFSTSKDIRFETNWDDVSGWSNDFDTTNWTFVELEPVTNLEGTLTVKPYFFVSARAKLFGVVGPRLDVGSYFKSETTLLPPSDVSSDLFSGVYCDAGIDMGVLDQNVNYWRTRVFGMEWLIWQNHSGSLPTIDFLTADPAAIFVGESSDLNWSVLNATDVTLDDNPVGMTGPQIVAPVVDTTYALQAQNATGATQSTAAVHVIEPDICPKMRSVFPVGGPVETGEPFSIQLIYSGEPDLIDLTYGAQNQTLIPPQDATQFVMEPAQQNVLATAITAGCDDSSLAVSIPPVPPTGCGIDWHLREEYIGDWASCGYYGVAWNGTRFVAVGIWVRTPPSSILIGRSSDGISWEGGVYGSAAHIFSQLTDVCWDPTNAQFVALGWEYYDGSTWDLALTSPDGVAWTETLAGQSASHFQDVIWNGAIIVAVGTGESGIWTNTCPP